MPKTVLGALRTQPLPNPCLVSESLEPEELLSLMCYSDDEFTSVLHIRECYRMCVGDLLLPFGMEIQVTERAAVLWGWMK